MAQQPGAPEQEAQATPTPQEVQAFLQNAYAQQRRRPEQPQVVRGDPKIEGQAQVEQVEQQILRTDYQGKRKEQLEGLEPAEFKGKMQRELTPRLKERIETQTNSAKKVRKHLEVTDGNFNPELDNREAKNVAHDVTVTVSMVAKAMEEGYITPPTHEPTKAVFNSLARKLRRHVEPETASYLQPLLNGILNEEEYIKFSEGDDLSTKFELDLKDILSARDDDVVENILTDIFTEVIDQKKIPRLTVERYRAKVGKAKQNRKEETNILKEEALRSQGEVEQSSREMGRGKYLEGYLIQQLENQIKGGQAEARPALELFSSLESADKFFGFYKKQFEIKLREELEKDRILPLGQELPSLTELHHSHPEKIERASKLATEEIHKLLIYTTHLIFTPVLEGDPSRNWQELIHEASREFGVNAQSIFDNFKNKFTFLLKQTSTLPGRFEEEGIPFFNFGIEEKDVYMHDDKGGKMVRKATSTPELIEMETFKEFLDRFHVALDTEFNLLQAGINYNFLLLTGRTEQQASFFKQAAAYAQQTLPSHRIDELYHLPYHELVHAAKIQLSSYFKKKFALRNWIKDPSLFHQAFDHNNKVQRAALFDLISNFAPKGTPEWAIRRAFFHARMHLSLISQEWHAYSGYAHPNLTRDFKPTYTDPALKNLETYQTWYTGQQWQVPDTFVQNLAFLPQPGRGRRYEKWMHEDVTREGRNIFQWKHDLGDMAMVEREYFKPGQDLNIFEFNPLKIGGIEQQGGYRLKYPSQGWVFDMLNHLGRDNEHLKMKEMQDGEMKDNVGALTEVWKRLENLGVDVVKHTFREHWMLGKETKKGREHFVQNADGTTNYDEQWKNFFEFLYQRYFNDEAIINRKAFSISYYDENLHEKKIDFSTIKSPEEFWETVVKPILHRKKVVGKGEEEDDAVARNARERQASIQDIVNHALTVMTFERLPMDFVFMENPSRSQNGTTLIKELQKEFITTNPERDEKKNQEESDLFEQAIDDILFVQERARADSIHQMNEFVQKQKDEEKREENRGGGIKARQLNIFARDMTLLKNEIFSGVRMIQGNDAVKGYLITEAVVKHFLQDKYEKQYTREHNVEDPNSLPQEAKDEIQRNIDRAVNLFNSVKTKIAEKPEENVLLQKKPDQDELKYYGNLEKILGQERIERDMKRLKISDKKEYLKHMRTEFEEAQNGLKTRAVWSGNELLSGQLGIGLNDMAYPFLDFSSVGQDMVFRTIDQIKDTQEMVYNYVSGGEFLSNLKKYYRKEDKEALFEKISDIRTKIKIWLTPSDYNGMAMRLVENAMNVMRINSDAEDNAVELAYMAAHRLRSAFSGVVKEGPEFPLRRENRYTFIEEFLHYAQFAKRATPEEMVYTPSSEIEQDPKSIGAKIAAIAGQIFGKKEERYVRESWKELSGEGLRSREFASIVQLVRKLGPTYLVLLAAALMLLVVRKGMEEAEM